MSKTAEKKADDFFFKGDNHSAYNLYLNIYKQSPNPIISLKLARCLINLNKTVEAAKVLSTIVDLNPPIWEARIRFIFCLNLLGKSEDAKKLLNKIPMHELNELDKLSALRTSIDVYGDLGESEKVPNIAKTVLDIRQDSYNSLLQYFVYCSPQDYDQELISKYEKIAKNTKGVSFSPNKEVDKLFYALARAHDALGDYKKAAKYLTRGSAIYSHNNKFDKEDTEKLREKSLEIFDKKFFSERKNWGNDSSKPIFVIGMPRSSTSLCEQILSSHSEVYGAGELQTIYNITGEIGNNNDKYFLDILPNLNSADVKKLSDYYIAEINKHSNDSKYVIDKLPLNSLYLGLIHLLLPNAKIIYCDRDLRDIAISLYSTRFTSGNEWAKNFDSIAYVMKTQLSLMKHWKSLFGDKIHNFSYENIVNSPKSEVKKLLEYCELDWEDSCLEFYKTKRTVQTASNAQVKQPIFKSSLGRWKNYEPYFGKELRKIGELND